MSIKATELAAVFYAIFDNTRGPVLKYQYPENYVSPELFNHVRKYVIPSAALASTAVTTEAFNHYVVGYPQRIEDPKYDRNVFIFDFCFVLKPRTRCPSSKNDINAWHSFEDSDMSGLCVSVQTAYEKLVIKINRYFCALEETDKILSKASVDTKPTHDFRFSILDSLFSELQSFGICKLSVQSYGSLYLKFNPLQCCSLLDHFQPEEDELVSDGNNGRPQSLIDLPLFHYSFSHNYAQLDLELLDECAFVLIAPPNSRAGLKSFDFVSQRILPHINGRRRLFELALLAKVDLTLTRICLVHLARAGVVQAVSAPTYLKSSLEIDTDPLVNPIVIPGWVGLPRLTKLAQDRTLAVACMDSTLLTGPNELWSWHNGHILSHLLHVYAYICSSPAFSLFHLISAFPVLVFVDLPLEVTDSPHDLFHQPNQYNDITRRFPVSLMRLIHFGEVNRLIRRIQCYPVSEQPLIHGASDDTLIKSKSPLPKTDILHCEDAAVVDSVNLEYKYVSDIHWVLARQFMDGLHTADAIGCALGAELFFSQSETIDSTSSMDDLMSEFMDRCFKENAKFAYSSINTTELVNIPTSRKASVASTTAVITKSILDTVDGEGLVDVPFSLQGLPFCSKKNGKRRKSKKKKKKSSVVEPSDVDQAFYLIWQ